MQIPRSDHLQVIPAKRKQNLDADLIPHRKLGKAEKSRSTEWREKTGKTKKAKAANMQSSVASIFNRVVNPRKAVLAERKESEEPDSDIEIIEPETQADIVAPGETLQVEAVVNLSTPFQLDGVGSNTDSPMPVVATETVPPLHGVESDTDCLMPDIAAETAPPPIGVDSVPAQASTMVPAEQGPILDNPGPAARGALKETVVKGNYAKIRLLIKQHRKALSKKEVLISNKKAASSILDLKALSQYNDKLLELSLEKIKLVASVKTTSRLLRPKLKQKISLSHPSEEASLAISHRCGKGSYYARVLREMVAQLLADGTLPEKHQGAGAHHEYLLDNPAIHDALQEWVKGTLEFDEGGFLGLALDSHRRIPANIHSDPKIIARATAVGGNPTQKRN
ncbi:hypothetical protein B0H13DRAFT_1873347 [Mycena leptocephala]|nr:hypothetical protein B0H13DRAFT_1873347 [Mycena leptocephala]